MSHFFNRIYEKYLKNGLTRERESDNIKTSQKRDENGIKILKIRKETLMKKIGVIMEDDLHKQLKLYAVNQDRTVTDIIVELVKKELETKKEQSR